MNDLSLRQASTLDLQNLFDLRNHSQVREQSHDSDIISFEEHQDWFRKALENNSKQILIAQKKSDFIGMVRLDFIDGAYLMSWAVHPEFQGCGFGKEMVSIVSKTVDNTLRAEIKQDNFSSIKIAEYIGMKLINKIEGILFYQK